MKFFLPQLNNTRAAALAYRGMKRYAAEITGRVITDRKIFRLGFTHREQEYLVEVGQPEQVSGEQVVAILESDVFMICTANRGVVAGRPIFVEKAKVHTVEDFES